MKLNREATEMNSPTIGSLVVGTRCAGSKECAPKAMPAYSLWRTRWDHEPERGLHAAARSENPEGPEVEAA